MPNIPLIVLEKLNWAPLQKPKFLTILPLDQTLEHNTNCLDKSCAKMG